MGRRNRDLFWPLIGLGAVLEAVAAALIALALVNPTEEQTLRGEGGSVEELLNRFAESQTANGFDGSDVALLAAGVIVAVVGRRRSRALLDGARELHERKRPLFAGPFRWLRG
jgi:hypothetical protein